MKDQALSSKIGNKKKPDLKSKRSAADLKVQRKRNEISRNPLKEFNGTFGGISSTSASVETKAQRSCLGIFLSNSNASRTPSFTTNRPKTSSAASTLTANGRPLKASEPKPLSENPIKPSVSQKSLQKSKKASVSPGSTTTPPLQVSVSPEIQNCDIPSTSTPACYGAGHVVSGIKDKRKCRPRGVLTVGENGSDKIILQNPSEASVQWLLSPYDESSSPSALPEVQGFLVSPPSCKAVSMQAHEESNVFRDNTPFSLDSLSSGNVIQTPQSDSSCDRNVGLFSWFNSNCHKLESESTSVSYSYPSIERAMQSQLRISWREGLVSRAFEIDEPDCCRCLSDDEEDGNRCSNLKNEEDYNPNGASDGEGKEKFCCAESISTDGGGLVASGDSDWTICYRNRLFDL